MLVKENSLKTGFLYMFWNKKVYLNSGLKKMNHPLKKAPEYSEAFF